MTGDVCSCGLSLGDGLCTFGYPPTLTTNRIIVNPSTNDPRTAIPFGRRRMRCPASAGRDRHGRRCLAREDTPNGTPGSQVNALSKKALFRHPIHWRDGDSVWPANVQRFRLCDVIGKGKRFRYGVVAKRNGGAVSGDFCACGLSLSSDHCTFDNPYPNDQPHYRQPPR